MLPPRVYQTAGTTEILARRRIILADDPGLGKTRIILDAFEQIPGKCLVVVGLDVTAGVWLYEIETWTANSKGVLYKGKPAERKAVIEEFKTSNVKYLIVHPSLLKEVVPHKNKIKFQAVVYDEFHRMGILNRKSKTLELAFFLKSIPTIVFASGTPISKGPHDLWPPLNVIDSKKFSSFWAFAEEQCVVTKGYFGWEVGPTPRDPEEFRKFVAPYLLRRRKKDVAPELPDKQYDIIPVTMSAGQQTLYDQILKEMFATWKQEADEKGEEFDEQMILTPYKINQLVRLRQLLVSPKVLFPDHSDYGQGMETLIELIGEHFDNGQPVFVAMPFRRGIEILRERLKELPGEVFSIVGGESGSSIDIAQRFQDASTKSKALLTTIKSAASYTATAASNGYFLGYEWSASEMLQTEDRIHRLNSKEKVFYKFIQHKDSLDEVVLNVVRQKRRFAEIILRPSDLRR